MKITRSQGTMVGVIMVLGFVLLVQWMYYNVDEITTQGPNPDGSWSGYAEPMVQVTGVMIELGDENVAMIFFTINAGNNEKYGGHVTVPVYPLTKEAVASEDSDGSERP